ncbi:MAG TPA: hypothetical protein VF808_17775 [Ktedonobacterales bacterium]
MDKSITDVVSHSPTEINTGPDLIAIGLLRLQQRLEALDRLYNEEIDALCQELGRLKADYIRLYQSKQDKPKVKQTRGQPSRTPPSAPPSL